MEDKKDIIHISRYSLADGTRGVNIRIVDAHNTEIYFGRMTFDELGLALTGTSNRTITRVCYAKEKKQ